MKSFLLAFFVTSCYVLGVISKTAIPSYVNLCKQTDPQLDACIINTVKVMKPHLAKGIPEMRIAPLEPFQISKLTLHAGNNLEVELSDVELRKLLSFDAKHLRIDLTTLQVDLGIHFPAVEVKGKYKLKGHIMVFDLDGSGDCVINTTNDDVVAKLNGEKKQKDGKEFIQFNHIDLDIKLGGGNLYFDNLFAGNKDLTEKTNAVLNENIKDILPEFEPIISNTLKSVILSIFNNVFSAFPFDELFPK